MLTLHVVPAHGDPFDHQLKSESLVIGRASNSDLVIADRFLSRNHARLFKQEDDWMIEDLGSRNGTLINGVAIAQASLVSPGDEVQISGSVISIMDPTATRGSASASLNEMSSHTIFRPVSELIESSAAEASAASAPVEVRRYTDRLKLLNEVHQALSGSIELKDLLELILERAFDHLQPEEGVIFMRNADGEYFKAAARSAPGHSQEYLYSETVVREVAEKGLAALVFDVETDERFGGAQSILSSGIRSLVAAPLVDPDGSLGMIALSSRINKRQFNEDDMELLVSLASVAAMRIRNVALAGEAAERRRLAEELELARHIQVSLLPASLPEIQGYEIHANNTPSRGVSGDYYVAVDRPDRGDLVLMLVDVSGKGMAASLLTSSLEALAAGPIEVGCPADEICARVSRRLYVRTPAAKYATGFVAILDPSSGILSYANAGHNPGLIFRTGGEVEQLDPTGMPLGLLDSADYTARETQMGVGDTVLLYTDGITEAENPEEDEYGIDRLSKVCSDNRDEPLADLAQAIEVDLNHYAQGVPFADDRTLVALRRVE